MIRNLLLNTFNNREIAIIVYLIIFFFWTFTQKNLRESIFGLLKTFTNRFFILSILALLIYVSLIIYGLYKIKFWDSSLLKDSIYWTFGVGFILMMNTVNAIKKDHYFKELLTDNFKLTIILEFITGMFVFSLITEFILIPFVIFFSMILAYSEVHDDEYYQVKNVMQIILGLAGIGYLIYSGYMIYFEFDEIASISTLKSFLFPIIMVTLFIPFAYFYALLMEYESLFVRLKFSFRNNPELQSFAKKRILIKVNFSLHRLRRFTPGIIFNQCNSENDVREVIKKILK